MHASILNWTFSEAIISMQFAVENRLSLLQSYLFYNHVNKRDQQITTDCLIVLIEFFTSWVQWTILDLPLLVMDLRRYYQYQFHLHFLIVPTIIANSLSSCIIKHWVLITHSQSLQAHAVSSVTNYTTIKDLLSFSQNVQALLVLAWRTCTLQNLWVIVL